MTDAELVREIAQPLSGDPNDYDKLLELMGNARFVLLGEATHGTHQFYSERATITKRLIAEKGFSILAMEADWPNSARVHRYVRGLPAVAGATEDTNADEALSGFRRFPVILAHCATKAMRRRIALRKHFVQNPWHTQYE